MGFHGYSGQGHKGHRAMKSPGYATAPDESGFILPAKGDKLLNVRVEMGLAGLIRRSLIARKLHFRAACGQRTP
jgi:hypothetical protein